MPLLDTVYLLARRERYAVFARRKVDISVAAVVVRVHIHEAFARNVPRLGIRIGIGGSLCGDQVEFLDAIRLRAAMDERFSRRSVRTGEDPDVPVVIDGNDRIVVRVGRLLVQQDSRLRNRIGGVVVVRHHMQQSAAGIVRSTVDKERLVDFLAVDRERTMLRAVRPQAAAVLVYIFVVLGLVRIPDAGIAVRRRQWIVAGEKNRARGFRRQKGKRHEKEYASHRLSTFAAES